MPIDYQAVKVKIQNYLPKSTVSKGDPKHWPRQTLTGSKFLGLVTYNNGISETTAKTKF